MVHDNTSGITVRSAFGIVGLSILLSLVLGAIVVIAFSPDGPESATPLVTAMALFTGQALMALPVIIHFLIRKQPLLRSLRFRPISLELFINTMIFGFGLLVVYDEVDRILSKVITPPEAMFDLSPYLSMSAPLTAITIILTMVVFAPIGEEIVFRGFLQRILEKAWKDPTKAVLITSMFFSIIHLNPYWLIQIYLWGVVLGYLAFQTRSIIPGIILHGLNNSASLLLNSTGLNIDNVYSWHGHVSPIFLFCSIVCLVIGFKRIQTFRRVKS